MPDEVIVTQTPPLYSCYGRRGAQVCVPITGARSKRILRGALNVLTGGVLLLSTDVWTEQTHQYFPRMIRACWRGWRIVLFEDRGTPHTAEDSLEFAAALGIEVRLLPKATPELNATDHLRRFVKGRGLASRSTRSIDGVADAACRYVLDMSRQERLRKAGVLSGNFWLTS